MTHVPIIGGGPAGMSCALWLANYGLSPVIIERESALGGMARRNPYPNPWLLGRPGALGRGNAAEFARHIETVAVECWLGCQPQRAERTIDGIRLELAFSDRRPPRALACPALVIATGTEFRGEDWLDAVPGARELARRGRVHLGPAWAGEPDAKLGPRIALIGGGDNAFDVARLLAGKGIAVTLVMRSRTPRAQPLLIERALAAAPGSVSVRANETVAALDDLGASVRLRLSGGSGLEVDHVVLLFGYRPSTGDPWLAALAPATDASGYLRVDGNMETSCPGVFAVGDVANPRHPCTATAIAAGTMAAREIGKRLTRSR